MSAPSSTSASMPAPFRTLPSFKIPTRPPSTTPSDKNPTIACFSFNGCHQVTKFLTDGLGAGCASNRLRAAALPHDRLSDLPKTFINNQQIMRSNHVVVPLLSEDTLRLVAPRGSVVWP